MSRALDVLHVLDSLGHGGAEQNLLSQMRRMPQHRHHLAWLYPDERLRERFAEHAASLVDLRVRRAADLPAAALRLAAWVRRHRPDVMHVQLVRAQLVGRAAAALAGGCPVVTTWQNANYEPAATSDFGGSPARQRAVRWLDRVSGRRDRGFIAVSQFLAERLGAQLGVARERITVVYNAVEPERYAPVAPEVAQATRAALGVPASAPVLLNVGRLVAQKGQVDAVAAMPDILRAVPEAHLVIAGASGNEEPRIVARIDELGLGSRVHLIGPRRDVPALYALADAFVFPSHYEGLSVGLVEAIASGLPAAISDIPQNREVVDGVGGVELVAPGAPAALARAVITVLAGPRRWDRATFSERFLPERLAAQTSRALEAAADA